MLAVGDARLPAEVPRHGWTSCGRTGQTLLFVSHILSDVRRLCPRVIYLDRAMVRADGPVDEVLDLYLQDVNERNALTEAAPAESAG